MKKAFEVWGWSATVLAHSPSSLIVFAAFLGLWALAAYEWLWIPESSVLVLLLSLVWAIAQVLVAVAALAGTFTSAVQAADANAQRLSLPPFFRFGRKRFAESLLLLIAASAIGLALAEIFAWVNQHSVEVASFLTFHSEKPVSYLIIDTCLMVIECLIWIAVAGSLLSFLLVLFSSGWQHARKQFGKVLMSSCFKGQFYAGLFSVIVFGGSAYVLANWRPMVSCWFLGLFAVGGARRFGANPPRSRMALLVALPGAAEFAKCRATRRIKRDFVSGRLSGIRKARGHGSTHRCFPHLSSEVLKRPTDDMM